MGHRRPGERLNMHALAEDFGVSVTPVREALQMLDREGLVSTKPRSGHFVTHLTLKQLLDWLELREILELGAVERAATRITDEQLQELEQVHAGYTGEDEESVECYLGENRRMHCLIAEASGNRQLAEMLGHVHDRLARFMVVSHAGQSMLEYRHEPLIKALRTRDPATARQVESRTPLGPRHDRRPCPGGPLGESAAGGTHQCRLAARGSTPTWPPSRAGLI